MTDGQPSDILDTTEAGQKIVRGGAVRTVGYAVGSGLAVISAAVLTRYLGPTDFGRYSVVFALLAIVTGIVDAGTATLGIREHSLLRGDSGRHFLRHLLGIRLAIATVGVVGALGFALLAGYDTAMIAGTALGGVGLLLLVVYGTLAIPLYSSLRLGWVTNLDLIRQGATVAGLVALAAIGTGIVPLLAVPIPVGLLLIAVTLLLIDQGTAWKPLADRVEWTRIARLMLPFAAATVSAIIYANVSVLALSVATTERETGLFAAAFRVYFVLATVPSLIVSSAFPLLARAARDDRERLAYAVRRLWEVCLVLGAGTALVAAIGAPIAIDIVAGPDYAAATSELRLLALALMGTFVIALGGFALLSLERYRVLVTANVAGLVLSATITLALGPSLGAQAAAIAVVTADLTLAAVYFGLLSFGPDRVGLTLAVIPKTAAAAALAAAPLLIPGIPVVLDAAISGAIFLAAAVLLKAVPDELMQGLRHRATGEP
jgi:O-antigen/teichoic acid export membrane protein